MVTKANILADTIYFIKNDFVSNITDPISTKRAGQSSFVMSSYPVKAVQYPLITLKIKNVSATRAGMQTTAQDIVLDFEIRVWARNEIEKDSISQQVLSRLANIQFTTNGSELSNLHELKINSATEIDEEGDIGGQVGIKSRIISGQYKFYNIT
jgi:hypothetical protein